MMGFHHLLALAAYVAVLAKSLVQSQLQYPACPAAYPVLIGDPSLPDYSLSASSTHLDYLPRQSRLHNTQGGPWAPTLPQQLGDYIQVDLGSLSRVEAVATQGQRYYKQFVTQYYLMLSADGFTFRKYTENGSTKLFTGNTDDNTVVNNTLPDTPEARYVRLYPTQWTSYIKLRWEVYVCSGIPLTTSTPTTTTPKPTTTTTPKPTTTTTTTTPKPTTEIPTITATPSPSVTTPVAMCQSEWTEDTLPNPLPACMTARVQCHCPNHVLAFDQSETFHTNIVSSFGTCIAPATKTCVFKAGHVMGECEGKQACDLADRLKGQHYCFDARAMTWLKSNYVVVKYRCVPKM